MNQNVLTDRGEKITIQTLRSRNPDEVGSLTKRLGASPRRQRGKLWMNTSRRDTVTSTTHLQIGSKEG